jgi:anti-sigma factor RsiW
LRELAWRRGLTEAERAELQAWLMAHPHARAEWEAEEQLNALLDRLPHAPVSSNFTARVMEAVEREAAAPKSRAGLQWNWLLRVVLPRVAVAAIVVTAGALGYHRYEMAQRAEFAKSLVAVSEVESIPGAALLENFDSIRRMGRTPAVDEELLALMQ